LDGPPHELPLSRELDGPESEPLLSAEISVVCNRLRRPLTASQLNLLDTYAQRLLVENRRANLTGASDRFAIYRRHFGESLALLVALETAGIAFSPLIDIGTGAGFPGLPMKIASPDLDVTLVEATGKKVRFLEAIVSELGLDRVRVVQARAEELAREPDFREAFPLAVARTVAPLPVLLELTLPFLQVGGYLAAPKGSATPREISESENALSELGGVIVSANPLELPFAGPTPTLVLVKKVAPTPDRYPRRVGIPNKRPL
jgi:16S rRNA (guanine527-N7)-methyltransferase